eukprot:scaffold1062_cov130-Cylindrotheca_fusiformis.AAC.41
MILSRRWMLALIWLVMTPRACSFQQADVMLRRSCQNIDSQLILQAMDSQQLRFYASGNYNSIPGLIGLGRSLASAAVETVLSNGTSDSISFPQSTSDFRAQPKRGYGPYIALTTEERDLFRLLRRARLETGIDTTLRVAGGWVRDKLLATPEFTRKNPGEGRLTSKYKATSMGRQGTKIMTSMEGHKPVDIDIALDDMLGREFADRLNDYLAQVGEERHTVGVVLKNPEKSKHLETATMKVGTFWIDFVNLRAEEYTQESRIPELMRIGSPAEDAFRRDLTINALFYNVNNGQVEDWTGRGFDDLRRGVVATPLAPLTTLLDDPLRALRSVRFAARLRFTMDDSLVEAAMDRRVRESLAEKVSRERIGGEVDLMLRSPDPVGAMRLLINLNLACTVFPVESCCNNVDLDRGVFNKGLELLSITHEHLTDCRLFPPMWCLSKRTYTTHGTTELTLREDEEARRLLWYASFLKPLHDEAKGLSKVKKSKRDGKKANRSAISRLLVDELKRPNRDAESIEKIIRGANKFTQLINTGSDLSAISVLLSDIRVDECLDSPDGSKFKCTMNGKTVDSATEEDPMWKHAMDFRLQCFEIMNNVGPLWRAALFLSLSEHMSEQFRGDLEYVIEGDIVDESQEELRQGEIERYDAFAIAMQRIGLVGIWEEKPVLSGNEMKKILPTIPKGPAFRDVMDEQRRWMVLHPGASAGVLVKHLSEKFPDYS